MTHQQGNRTTEFMNHQQRLYSNGLDLVNEADLLFKNGMNRRCLFLYLSAFEQFEKLRRLLLYGSVNKKHDGVFKVFDNAFEYVKERLDSVLENPETSSEQDLLVATDVKNRKLFEGLQFIYIRHSCLYEDKEITTGYDLMTEWAKPDNLKSVRSVVMDLKDLVNVYIHTPTSEGNANL